MSDSPLEELEAHEHAEHAHHAAHEGDSFVSQVTMTIAILAVLAAVGASLENIEGDKTIASKNEATLEQSKASDQWAFFQAKSVKKNLYQLASEQGGPNAARYAAEAAKNGADQDKISKEAKAFEEKRNQKVESAELHEARHGRLTIASTLLHMSIAIATLSIILRRRWPWLTAMALSLGGVAVVAWAYL
jgi:Domain of unknown function (DUF4337)